MAPYSEDETRPVRYEDGVVQFGNRNRGSGSGYTCDPVESITLSFGKYGGDNCADAEFMTAAGMRVKVFGGTAFYDALKTLGDPPVEPRTSDHFRGHNARVRAYANRVYKAIEAEIQRIVAPTGGLTLSLIFAQLAQDARNVGRIQGRNKLREDFFALMAEEPGGGS